MTNCKLCTALKDANSTNPSLWNKKLYETESFVILPTIGPFVQGHVIIVSKAHFPSLSSMGIGKISECYDLISRIIETQEVDILFTEHGSFNQQDGGACIVHTHIHVIPEMGQYFDVLNDVLPDRNTEDKFAKFSDLNTIDFPYILNLNSKGRLAVYEAYNAHSQMMRKAICAKANRTDWDWERDPKVGVIESTVAAWKQ